VLAKSNVQYEALIKEHDDAIVRQTKAGDKFAPALAKWDSEAREVHKKERKAVQVEKKLD